MSKQVLVAGSLHYDLVVHADRFPVIDEYAVGHSASHVPGGKGGNQALASALCGATTWLAGRVGDDDAGRILTDNLSKGGVDVSLLQVGAGETTGSSIAVVNEFGDFGAVVLPGANANFDAGSVTLPSEVAFLVLQSELPAEANLVLARKAAAAGLTIVLNACPFRESVDDVISLTNTLILGSHEAEALTGRSFSTIGMALEAIQPIAERVPRVIFFLSGGGMVQMERGGRPEYHAAREKRPESMHGAQDFFVGAYVSQIAGGSEFEAATHYAQAAATLFMSTPVERRDLIRATQIRARLSEDDR
jgi:ribokinase